MRFNRVHIPNLWEFARSEEENVRPRGDYALTTRDHPSEADARVLDDHIYDKLLETYPRHLLQQCLELDCICCTNVSTVQDEEDPKFFYGVTTGHAATLTSITFDWLLNGRAVVTALTSTRPYFPRLRAFQVRNAVESPAKLEEPYLPGLQPWSCLFGKLWLDFLRLHPGLECLAWPMEYFLPLDSDFKRVDEEVLEVLHQLGRRLKSLRVDTCVLNHHFNDSDMMQTHVPMALARQKAFVSLIAPHMKCLEVIKAEGTIPIELRYALLLALQQCPLQKVVVIGVNWAVADTWTEREGDEGGSYGHRANRSLDISDPIPWKQTLEPVRTIPVEVEKLLISRALENLSIQDEWPCKAELSLLKCLASTQAATVTDLKFCGFDGAPMLYYPSPKAQIELSFLKKFHILRHFTTAVWLSTHHAGEDLSERIYDFWTRKASVQVKTSIVPLSNRQQILERYYAPDAIAAKVAELVGPHLSPLACSRRGGVTVKALLLMQKFEQAEIFEIEVQIGLACKVGSHTGLRGENHPVKLREKMLNRKWF
ncbi:hypothetical protein MMC19_001502 [Ptychographa xylographoides]|nr:hypothetical protein [Ptychographa xylographoides]